MLVWSKSGATQINLSVRSRFLSLSKSRLVKVIFPIMIVWQFPACTDKPELQASNLTISNFVYQARFSLNRYDDILKMSPREVFLLRSSAETLILNIFIAFQSKKTKQNKTISLMQYGSVQRIGRWWNADTKEHFQTHNSLMTRWYSICFKWLND